METAEFWCGDDSGAGSGVVHEESLPSTGRVEQTRGLWGHSGSGQEIPFFGLQGSQEAGTTGNFKYMHIFKSITTHTLKYETNQRMINLFFLLYSPNIQNYETYYSL